MPTETEKQLREEIAQLKQFIATAPAQKEKRVFDKPVSAFQEKSVFTLLVYFKDGLTNGCKFHSWKHDKRKWNGLYVTDNRYSLNRLVYLVEDQFKDTYKTAIVYLNETKIPIMKYAYGVLKDIEYFEWQYDADGSVLFKLSDKKGKMMNQKYEQELKKYRV
jgi:hypothetical protein